MNKIKLEMAQGPKLAYEPVDPDFINYPNRQGEAGRQDLKMPYMDFGTERHEDKARYTSREVMEAEWSHLWTKTWVICGHVSDLPKPGRYMKVDLGRESFIVIRQPDNSIKALYNVCQHRGTQLVTQDFGAAGQFTCPFHLWQFGIDGKCLKVTDRETFRKKALDYDLDIPQVRVDVWKGFIFLTMNKNAPPLTEFLGADLMHTMDAYPYEHMVRIVDIRQEWPYNWKIALEAFAEGYHLQVVHPQLIEYVDIYHNQIDMYANGHSRQIVPYMRPTPAYADKWGNNLSDEHKLFLKEAGIDPETFKGGASDVRPAVIEKKRAYAKSRGYDFGKFDDEQLCDDWTLTIFPACTFNTFPETILVQRFWPHPTDPEKMHYFSQVWALPNQDTPNFIPVTDEETRSGKGILNPTYPAQDDLAALGPVLSQDATLMPRVQSRMRSEGFRGALYSEQEVRIRQFYAELDRYLQNKV